MYLTKSKTFSRGPKVCLVKNICIFAPNFSKKGKLDIKLKVSKMKTATDFFVEYSNEILDWKSGAQHFQNRLSPKHLVVSQLISLHQLAVIQKGIWDVG